MSSRETERPVMNATRARQGRWGRPVFWVLLFGTLLAALGMFAAWSWKSADEGPAGTGQETVDGRGYGAPEPPSPNPQTP
ncbi:MAG: hypothetical protein A2790_10265 [Phenylobacterium sp. RIFCSPHIGHO2_01_FULL_69_31]|jgi:hypothetical protein|uniref:hypothetical protein n=1 Tax=Phenylobacterium sp. RIFCSPHIGHO2_01_FULL_69_31 TaxID=1801944 RepID=UPI0008B345AB|nr:hypothetical protein [Phenylobacterium sp. RIFCSPHIGHO2_01_FULL_69_31]OHB31034.1 MAG: hypothetical protein A2790_10265 [Phenylobacterium sp. RIFCSPHIGHO2_01_FULL_69_31]